MRAGVESREHALIVAFDGIVADTPALRQRALSDAFGVEGVQAPHDDIGAALCGRTLGEAARHCLESLARTAGGLIDETLADLVALRAARLLDARLSQGAVLAPQAAEWITRRAAAGRRIALRADSDRRQVAGILQLAGLEHHIGLLVCGDDAQGASRTVGSALHRGWARLDQRLRALGHDASARTAFEACPRAAQAARPYANEVLGALE